MARQLTAGVVVRHPGSGQVVFLASGSNLPGWAEGMVGDHALTLAVAASPQAPAPTPEPERPQDPPPRGGPGSGRQAWLAYARANGVDVADGADRDTIIDACRRAGVPVD